MKHLLALLLLLVTFSIAPAQSGTTPGDIVTTNRQSGTTYTVKSSDRGRVVVTTNAGTKAVSLPVFSNGWFAWFYNTGAGAMTITPASGTIGGGGSLVLAVGASAKVVRDSTGYVITQKDLSTAQLAALAAAGTVTNVLGVLNETDSTGGTTPAIGLVPVPVADNFVSGLTSTATAVGTTTLTVASKRTQVFTGSTTQTIVLPVVTTLLQVGFSFDIQNDSSGALTINSSGGNLVQTMAAGTRATITCKLLTGTSAASWNSTYVSGSGISGLTTNQVPKATSATTLGDSRILDQGAGGDVNIDSDTGSVAIGDVAVVGNGSKITIEDLNKRALIHANNVTVGNADSTSKSYIIINDAPAVGDQSIYEQTRGEWGAGDINNFGNGTKIEINDATNSASISAGGSSTDFDTDGAHGSFIGAFSPPSAGNGSLGSTSKPFAAVVVGGAADNSFTINGTFTGNRTGTPPDASGVLALVGVNLGTVLPVDMANGVLSTATGAVYSSPGSTSGLTAGTEGNVSFPVPRAGTVRNLYVRTGGTAKVSTPSTVITIRKNGVDTAVTLTLTQTVNTTSSDLTHSFSVAAGDLITVSFTTTGAAAVSTSIAAVSFELD